MEWGHTRQQQYRNHPHPHLPLHHHPNLPHHSTPTPSVTSSRKPSIARCVLDWRRSRWSRPVDVLPVFHISRNGKKPLHQEEPSVVHRVNRNYPKNSITLHCEA